MGAAVAFCQAISPNSGRAVAHFRIVRRSYIDRLQAVYYILSATFIALSRAVAGKIQIYANSTFVGDLFQDAVAGWEIDVAIAQVVDALEEFGSGGIFLFDLTIGQDQVGFRSGPTGVFVIHE